jgi:dinuclear metal center YbgI/SA1388 family protein
VGALDRELNVASFKDDSHNGLQVENSGCVRKVCCGVDASLEFFEAARKRKADLVVCHHGLSWGDSLKRITGINHGRLAFLIRNDMALYACHLPLDAHPRLGNNAQIARVLGLRGLKPFGLYAGRMLGFRGTLPKALPYARFRAWVGERIGGEVRSMDFGRQMVRTVAVVSGGAAEEADEAGREGVDVYLTGEPKLMAYSLAREYGINVVFAGHYATEVFGVRALADYIRRRFRVAAEFVDLGVPF